MPSAPRLYPGRPAGVRYGRSGCVHTLLTLGSPHQSIENYPLGRAEVSLLGGHCTAARPAKQARTLVNAVRACSSSTALLPTPGTAWCLCCPGIPPAAALAHLHPLFALQESLLGPNVDAAPPGVRGSSLQFANHFYPHADALGGVRVVCACGDAIRGRLLWDGGSSGGGSDDGGTSGSSSNSSFSDGSHDGGSDPGRGLQSRCGSRWDAYVAYEGYKVGSPALLPGDCQDEVRGTCRAGTARMRTLRTAKSVCLRSATALSEKVKQ